MKKKKLLITGSTFPRWEGDTEPRFILDYAKVMTKYYDVTVLVPATPGAAEQENMEGVNVIRFHYFPLHRWETLCYPGAIIPRIKEKKTRLFLVPFLLFSMKNNFRKYSKQVDLVHAHWLIPQGVVQSGIKETPYFVTGHGGDVSSLNFSFIKRMKAKCLSNAIMTVGVSEYICQKMKEINPQINPQIISMGCDLTKFSPDKRDENYFGHSNKNILFVGRLAEKKGVTYLIEAMKNVDAKLYIVGKGPLEGALRKQAEVLGDKIVFLGAKSHEELPTIYASADIFVAPSVVAADGDREGLPVTMMEAMASGLPVVSGISGGTEDIIDDGVNGFIVDAKDILELADKINQIVKNDDLAEKMRVEARKTSGKYSYQSIGEEYNKLIRKALESV